MADSRAVVLLVVGTRPEAIKLAPVVESLRGSTLFRPVILATSQHREMLRQALAPFGLEPDTDLEVMTEGQSPTAVAARVLARIERPLAEIAPAFVVVQGDTTTALAAAWASFHAGVPVAHVEAGLRSGRVDSPFPEEFNRRGVAVAASLHFAPTVRARENLLREGVDPAAVFVVGNTVVDAVARILSTAPQRWPEPGRATILVTLHRRESFGAPLERALGAIRSLALERGDTVRIVFPVHPNPNVSVPARRLLDGLPNVELCDPLDYPGFLAVFSRSRFAISDSGGVQEEAPCVGVPVLVARETTERPEVIGSGWGVLVGTDSDRILAESRRLLDDEEAWRARRAGPNPFGDGQAARRIVDVLSAARGRRFATGAAAAAPGRAGSAGG
ncbi:MAG: UDP-N-acetylglucosamine 2-epimerase (non-hydrolyzing) [Thermoanaerobaculia bacterium]|nr:UDP-N-acetylglucosamine 2-epimerase (non-hydrolyzing) [Thermoanaerobaculia bacterium]